MSEPDLRAMDVAGGRGMPIAILPTAAAPDHNHLRAGRNGQRWFESLGSKSVEVVPVINRESAERADLAARVAAARLIYLLGGFPRYLCDTLRDSRVWLSALEAQQAGAVIGGSSAGAMVLAEQYYDPQEEKLFAGLNLLPNICILPHHNRVGKSWSSKIRAAQGQLILLGIDEQTGLINERADPEWTVYGAGSVTVYDGASIEVYARGSQFRLSGLHPVNWRG